MKKYKISIVLVLFFVNAGFLLAQSDSNKLDANGLKHGLWKGFYQESKRLRYEGYFIRGKETGLFKFFDDTKAGSVIATREFSPQDGSAYTIFYDQSRNKVSEGKVVDKLFEGEWKYYHQASSIVMSRENYKKGKLEGMRTVYFPDGKIAEQSTYCNNLKDGEYKKYLENGVILEESFYKNSEYDGLAIFRDINGNVVSKGMFVKGVKSGVWEVRENGKLVNKTFKN